MNICMLGLLEKTYIRQINVPHQAGVNKYSFYLFRAQCAQTQDECNSGIYTSTDKEKDPTIFYLRSDFIDKCIDLLRWLPNARGAAAHRYRKSFEHFIASFSVNNFWVKLNSIK